MDTTKPTLTLRRKVSLPPRALTRLALQRSSETLRHMQHAAADPVVIVQRDDAEVRRLRQALSEAEAERDSARAAALERLHREERVQRITLHVCDRRAEWAAKAGLRRTQRQPLVALHSTRIVTADVWMPTEADAEG